VAEFLRDLGLQGANLLPGILFGAAVLAIWIVYSAYKLSVAEETDEKKRYRGWVTVGVVVLIVGLVILLPAYRAAKEHCRSVMASAASQSFDIFGDPAPLPLAPTYTELGKCQRVFGPAP
jgi:hypothetical protein